VGRRPLGFRLALGLSALLIPSLAAPGRAAAPAQNPDVKAGQALYVTHCAACHGNAGRGDGPSAAGFATKPADLTDDKWDHGSTDGELFAIIWNGAPAAIV